MWGVILNFVKNLACLAYFGCFGSMGIVFADSGSQLSAPTPLTPTQQIQRLENQVSYLNQMQSQVSQHQKQITQLTAQVDQLNQQVIAEQALIEQLQKKMVTLESRDIQKSPAPLAAPPLAPSSDLKPAIKPAIKSTIQSEKPKIDSKATVPVQPSAAEQAMYQRAYGLLIKKQYAAAIQAFQQFVKRYPQSSRKTDAAYWLGELYLTEGHPDMAAEQFRQVIRDPHSGKRPDAMMALGTIFLASGDTAHAKQMFESIMKEYPKTQAAEMAASKLKGLKASR